MAWSLSIGLAAFFAALFLLGLWVGRRGRKAALAALLVCVPFAVLWVALRYWPSAGYALARTGPWGRIYVWWPVFFAFIVLGIAASGAVPRKARIAFITCAAVYALVTLYRLFAVHACNLAPLDHNTGADGVCRQMTGWTCGPASAVTLLAAFGISASEGEMTRLSLAEPFRGVDDVQLALAIREKALPAGYDVVVARSNWQDLRSRKLPVVVVFKLLSHLDHCAPVLAVDEQHVTLADPLSGTCRMPRDEFLAKWRKALIALQPAASDVNQGQSPTGGRE